MTRLSIALGVALSAAVADVAAVRAQETLTLSAPPGGWCAALTTKVPTCWKPAEPPHETKDYLLMEFIREDDVIANWRELTTVQQFRRTKNTPSPLASYEAMKTIRAERCPGATEFQLLEETSPGSQSGVQGGLIYEWRTTAPCAGFPPQVELVRLIFAKRTWYRVAYNTRSELSPEARQDWLEWLRRQELKR